MKTCKDCKFSGGGGTMCKHPNNLVPDLVEGGNKIRWLAESNREDGIILMILFRTCGKIGRWYEPREPA